MNPPRTVGALGRLVSQSVLLALGQIRANLGRSILTTLGIVIGVATVAGVITALTGLKANMLQKIESFGVNKIVVMPYRPEAGPSRHAGWGSIRLRPEEFDGLLEHCPSVSAFSRMARRPAEVRNGRKSVDVRLLGVESSWHEIEARPAVLGRPFSLIEEAEGKSVCLLTPSVRDALGLDRDCIGQRIHVAGRPFVIVGVVKAPSEPGIGGEPGGVGEVWIPSAAHWRLYGGYLWAVAVSRSPELSPEAQAELRFFLRRRRDLKPGEPDTFRLWAASQWLARFHKASAMITLIAGGIAGISLLVGGVGIMNIMLVSVSERTREIGLRKAVGARPAAIWLQFLIEAVVLCLIGGLLGLLAGRGFIAILAAFPETELQHARIGSVGVSISFGFAAVVGIVFGFFPALRAARLNPIDALRHE